MDDALLLQARWGLPPCTPRPDLAIPGSPERCIRRRVLEDASGGLWLLEELGPSQAPRREALGHVLNSLAARGLAGLAPYRRALSGAFVCQGHGRCWQLSPFIPGKPLLQPDYLGDDRKGDALGAWLAAFRSAAENLEPPDGLFTLDLPAYIAELLTRLARVRPAVHSRAAVTLPALTELFAAWNSLPLALAHGDVHPLNAVWGTHTLKAVIDWEFCGLRPEIYDLANCLGCLAIEGDGGLGTPFARALLARTLDAGLYAPQSARLLVQAVLATRFGWLSEWLRRRDDEMIALELDFMDHLAAHAGQDAMAL